MSTTTNTKVKEVITLPQDFSLAQLTFVREGDDLVVRAGEQFFVVEGYFSSSAPVLATASGGFLSPDFVAAFLQGETLEGETLEGGTLAPRYALGFLGDLFSGGGRERADRVCARSQRSGRGRTRRRGCRACKRHPDLSRRYREDGRRLECFHRVHRQDGVSPW